MRAEVLPPTSRRRAEPRPQGIVCTLEGSATPLSYESSREGEAGFVPEGTPYYAIAGCPQRMAIAAEWQGRLDVFVRVAADATRPPQLSDLSRECRGA